jgi:6-pyruvoyl-tetrahydropterin synthase
MQSFLLLLCALLLICSARARFSLGVRDSIMIAHSFEGEAFGPAQNMHGATYTVDVELSADALEDKVNWVVDIGAFSSLLAEVLCKYNFKNLNELFPTENTTTEFMCRRIHNDLAARLKTQAVSGGLSVKLHESHKAWARCVASFLAVACDYRPVPSLTLSLRRPLSTPHSYVQDI